MATIPTITYTIKSSAEGKHDAAPGWCIAFVRYTNPCSGYSQKGSLLQTKPLLVVENDCVSIGINNPKGSFAKTMTLTLKAGDVYYFNAVSPGDWVCAWISDQADDIKNIVDILDKRAGIQKTNGGSNNQADNQNQLNNWDSGLKFMGRVLSVTNNDTLQGTKRVVTQTVTCQAFLELASSVYFTDFAKVKFQPAGQSADATDQSEQSNKTEVAYKIQLLNNSRFKGFADKFYQFMENSSSDPEHRLSPDSVIKFLMILLFGMHSGELGVPGTTGPLQGNVNDAIRVPFDIAWISGQPNVQRLWQFYTVLSGVQSYGNQKQQQIWQKFYPDVHLDSLPQHNMLSCLHKLKGWVIFNPPVWSNQTYWSILSQYLNPTLNEMYTCLKVDKYNRIRPHVVIREVPFSTGLYQTFKLPKMGDVTETFKSEVKKNAITTATQDPSHPKTGNEKTPEFNAISPAALKEPRTMYRNLPRWVIDESMIYSLNVATNEANRVNYLQIWGQQLGNAFAIAPNSNFNGSEWYRFSQFLLGNYVCDNKDISRNGLRAEISETGYDLPLADGVQSHTPIWARMRADWRFNGHLKPAGTVTLYGVTAPICEGDNCEIRGIVYHIDQVNHSGTLSGKDKTFRTVLSISNGILASSLRSDKDIPKYPAHLDHTQDGNPGPGVIDAEFTGRPDRDSNGDRVKKKKSQ